MLKIDNKYRLDIIDILNDMPKNKKKSKKVKISLDDVINKQGNLNIQINNQYDALVVFATIYMIDKYERKFNIDTKPEDYPLHEIISKKIEEIIKNKVKDVKVYCDGSSVSVYVLGFEINLYGIKKSDYIAKYMETKENKNANPNPKPDPIFIYFGFDDYIETEENNKSNKDSTKEEYIKLYCTEKIVSLAESIRYEFEEKDVSYKHEVIKLRCKKHAHIGNSSYITFENDDLYIMKNHQNEGSIFNGDLCEVTYINTFKDGIKINKSIFRVKKIEQIKYKTEIKEYIVINDDTKICMGEGMIRRSEIAPFIKEEFIFEDKITDKTILEGDLCRVYYKHLVNSLGIVKSIIEKVDKIEDDKGRVSHEYYSTKLVVRDSFKSDEFSNNLFEQIIALEQIRPYVNGQIISKNDLCEVKYKKIIADKTVLKYKILSVKKLDNISYIKKIENLKVKKIHSHGFFANNIEFENGCKYRAPITRVISCICPTPEQAERMYKEHNIIEDDVCKVTYLEILQNKLNIGITVVLDAEKIK